MLENMRTPKEQNLYYLRTVILGLALCVAQWVNQVSYTTDTKYQRAIQVQAASL